MPFETQELETYMTEEEQLLADGKEGWWVAYDGNHRVALEPTIEALLSRITEVMGHPRPGCLIKQIKKVEPTPTLPIIRGRSMTR
jgi:hypothetical protein